jgi:superfamily II DNA or RNA helicase
MDVISIRNMATVRCDTEDKRARIMRALTLHNTYDDSTLMLYNMLDGLDIEVPIGMIPRPVECRPWEAADIQFTGELWDKYSQPTLVQSYLDYIQKGHSGGIIQSPVGSGKSVMATYIMSQLGLKTLIIVPTDYLMGQWRDYLKTFSKMQDKEIGTCRANVCDYENKKVVIAMIHSVAKENRYPAEFYNQFGLCIVDEVHRLAAPTFSQSLPKFWSKYRLGMSATPRRKDGYENAFLFHIGKVCTPEVSQQIKPRAIIMHYYNQETHHSGCVWSGKLSLGKYFNKLGRNESRNRFLASVIIKLFNKGKDTLILSDRLQQLQTIKEFLLEGGINSNAIGIFTGQSKSGLDRKIILATYGSAGLGANIPRLSAVVFATPRADIEQAVGRVLRKEQDEPQVIIDVVDTASHIMVGWAHARMKLYKRIASKIDIVTI